jgi:hypothetical protein
MMESSGGDTMLLTRKERRIQIESFNTKLKLMTLLDIYPELKRFLIRLEVLCRITAALYRESGSDELLGFLIHETGKLRQIYQKRINPVSYPAVIRRQFNQYSCNLLTRLSDRLLQDTDLFTQKDELAEKKIRLILIDLGSFILN